MSISVLQFTDVKHARTVALFLFITSLQMTLRLPRLCHESHMTFANMTVGARTRSLLYVYVCEIRERPVFE